ncbi:YaiO family outer membrane beta-barrel protein [Sphingomonas ginkgonis]|uniref:YaiO family outer membrane beta-barrel protein n=1 Tax=Sphingomonas ginkgonis TaxID=2315330 RepID=A0A429VA06_9SPHN|nr:YaiO family outer membrane beta-barrel protein [Sphingomonas ginkgonis]RST30692.1 YaiO family outer membrane beta-barrel protein [Sphingomonas ginkgonis]
MPVLLLVSAALAAAPLPVTAVDPTAYDRAVAARRAHRPEDAVQLLEPLLAAEPGNVDARVQYGYALLALGRSDAAAAAFTEVLRRAPGYADARDGLALARRRRAEVVPRWRLDLDAGTSAVRGQPDWRELDGQLRYQLDARTALTGRIEATRRFGLDDTYGEVRVDARVSPRVDLYASAGGTPGADYRPRWQLGGGLAARLTDGGRATVLTLDARAARYASGRVETLVPGVQQYVAGGRAWVTAQWINLFADGRHRSGLLGRGDVQASERLRLFAGAARAPDTSEGIVTRVTTVFGGVAATLDPRHELRLSAAHVDQSLGPSRTDLSLGLGVRF